MIYDDISSDIRLSEDHPSKDYHYIHSYKHLCFKTFDGTQSVRQSMAERHAS